MQNDAFWVGAMYISPDGAMWAKLTKLCERGKWAEGESFEYPYSVKASRCR